MCSLGTDVGEMGNARIKHTVKGCRRLSNKGRESGGSDIEVISKYAGRTWKVEAWMTLK